MGINIEKILTISAGDWFKMNNKNPKDYKPVGIHTRTDCGDFDSFGEAIKDFSKETPKKTEVVVDYKAEIIPSVACYVAYLYGTALILK